MATNEGVGKKIVEALKKQTSNDFEQNLDIDITDNMSADNFEIEEPAVEEVSDDENIFAETKSEVDEIPPYDEQFEIKEQPGPETSFSQEIKVDAPEPQTLSVKPSGWNFEEKQDFEPAFNNQQIFESSKAKQFDMPPNVSVLKKLITQLPTGVTKQTGAQIIKQTMEALGISMNSVLHDAQKVQDEMNESIKNCMLSIQEYKNNIKNLEKQGLDYQRQVNQLNDLISLFILSDKD